MPRVSELDLREPSSAWRLDISTLALGTAVPLVAFLIGQFAPPSQSSYPLRLAVLSTGMVTFNVIAFLRDGGSRITPLGIFQLASAIFASATPMLMWTADYRPNPELTATLGVIHIVNVAVYGLVCRHTVAWDAETHRRPTAHPAGDHDPAHTVMTAGIALMAIASTLLVGGVTVGGVPARLAHGGVVLIGAAASYAVPRTNRRPWTIALMPIMSVVIYVTFFFAGFGRLIVATLVLSIAVAENMARPRRWHKIVMVLGVGPALIIGGMVGIDRSPVTAGEGSVEGVLSEGRGLESVFSPADTFATLVDLDDSASSSAFPRQHGRTYVESVFTWIPRSWWPEKPAGFGFRLTQVLAPRLMATGHSMAALAWGEWFVNFGWLGVAVSAPIFSVLLVALARWQHSLWRRESWSADVIIGAAMCAVASAGIADYVWVGSFTYVARSGLVLLVLSGARLVVRHLLRPGRTLESRALNG